MRPSSRRCAALAAAGLLCASAVGAAEVPVDSLRLRRPVRVEGGTLLSSREVRRLLPADREQAWGPAEVQTALERLGAVLVDQGHYQARLALRPLPDGGAILQVDEGTAARWDTLQVAADSAQLAGSRSLRPRRGDRFEPARLDELLQAWVGLSVEAGYPFAAARIESVKVEAGAVRAGARLEPGPFCHLAEVEFPGLRATRESFLRRWLRVRPGRVYRESDWEEAPSQLERTGLFSSVGDPVVLYLGDGRVRVDLPVEEGKHNRLEGAVGYTGRTKSLSGVLDLSLGDLFGTGRSLSFRWDRPREEQSRLRLSWREPLLGPLPIGSLLTLDQEDQDSIYSRLVLEGRLDALLGSDLTAYVGGEYHRSLLGEEPAERIRRISSLVGLRWETIRPGRWRGRLLDVAVRSGRSHIRPPGGGPEERVRLERGTITWEEVRLWRERLAGRLRLRGDAIGRNDRLPVSDALRLGGAGSVRGYEEEAFLARRSAAAQVEAGPIFPGGQAYLFADGGWWRTLPVPGDDRDAFGFGVGVRSESAWRSLTVDVGVPRGGSVGEARLHIRLERRF